MLQNPEMTSVLLVSSVGLIGEFFFVVWEVSFNWTVQSNSWVVNFLCKELVFLEDQRGPCSLQQLQYSVNVLDMLFCGS